MQKKPIYFDQILSLYDLRLHLSPFFKVNLQNNMCPIISKFSIL